MFVADVSLTAQTNNHANLNYVKEMHCLALPILLETTVIPLSGPCGVRLDWSALEMLNPLPIHAFLCALQMFASRDLGGIQPGAKSVELLAGNIPLASHSKLLKMLLRALFFSSHKRN
jgi:hypothetical protein